MRLRVLFATGVVSGNGGAAFERLGFLSEAERLTMRFRNFVTEEPSDVGEASAWDGESETGTIKAGMEAVSDSLVACTGFG